MKKTISTLLLTMVTAITLACSGDQKTQFTATKTGVGPITIGMSLDKIPASVDKLYDKWEKEFISNDLEGDYTLVHFTLEGKPIMDSYESENTIGSLTILSPNIANEDGIRPGTSVKTLFDKGAKGQSWNDGSFALVLNDNVYKVTGLTEAGNAKLIEEYSTGKETMITLVDFETSATVVSFDI